jgi:hypothetical protein
MDKSTEVWPFTDDLAIHRVGSLPSENLQHVTETYAHMTLLPLSGVPFDALPAHSTRLSG